MANSNRIGIDGLADAVNDILTEYGDDIRADLEPVLRKTANKVKKEIKQSAPGSGEYAKTWSVKAQRSRLGTSFVVYSKKPGLPHLLEYGHMMRNGKRSKAYPHIASAEANAESYLMTEVERALK